MIGKEYFDLKEARDRIAELERELDVRKAAIEAQFRLVAQVKELERENDALGATLKAANDRNIELEKALRQIATGADPGDVGDGLTYAEIQSIANGALVKSSTL